GGRHDTQAVQRRRGARPDRVLRRDVRRQEGLPHDRLRGRLPLAPAERHDAFEPGALALARAHGGWQLRLRHIMQTVHTDVLIVGTGFGAAAPALRLAEAGAKVVMVEKGPRVQTADFRQTSDPQYLLKYIKGAPGDHLSLTYAEALGGGSGFYEMVSLRAPSLVSDQVDAQGRRPWPAGLDRSTLDPYYDVAERMLHVSQIPLEEVPKTGLVFAQLMRNLGYSVDRARYAVRGCQGSGFCVTGCIYGAKQSLFLNYLPQAVAASAEIETDLEALSIESLPGVHRGRARLLANLPYRYQVLCRRRAGEREQVRFVARPVV